MSPCLLRYYQKSHEKLMKQAQSIYRKNDIKSQIISRLVYVAGGHGCFLGAMPPAVSGQTPRYSQDCPWRSIRSFLPNN